MSHIKCASLSVAIISTVTSLCGPIGLAVCNQAAGESRSPACPDLNGAAELSMTSNEGHTLHMEAPFNVEEA